MTDEISDAILENAQGPAEASVDGVNIKQHPLMDQIEADRYLNSRQASRARGLGIGLKKLVPPGTD